MKTFIAGLLKWWNGNGSVITGHRVCVTTWHGCMAHITSDKWGTIDRWRDDVVVIGGRCDMVDVTYDDGSFDVVPVSEGTMEWRQDHWRLYK